jgi:hypothetical protein
MPTTRARRLKLSCQQRRGDDVAEHGSVDDVGEVAFEDEHGFSAGVAVAHGVVVELACPGFAAKLDHRGSVDDCVQASVAASVEAVSDRSTTGFSGAGGDGGGAVEAAKPASVKRRTSPVSSRISAAARLAMPGMVARVEPVWSTSLASEPHRD